MEHKTCIFCDIITQKDASVFVDQDEHVVVLQDKYPKAPIHYLIIPKKHIENIAHFTSADAHISSSIFAMAKKLSQKDGKHAHFRLISNNGKNAGQEVFHTHIHFIAGHQDQE